MYSEAMAASAPAAVAVAAVKQEPVSASEDVKEMEQAGQEAREQLARRDAELARERAACFKLQRCAGALPPRRCLRRASKSAASELSLHILATLQRLVV